STSIREAGQRIGRREPLELTRELDAVGDVHRKAADAERLTIPVRDGKANAGEVSRAIGGRNGIRDIGELMAFEDAAIGVRKAFGEQSWEELRDGATDRSFARHAELRERVRPAAGAAADRGRQ